VDINARAVPARVFLRGIADMHLSLLLSLAMVTTPAAAPDQAATPTPAQQPAKTAPAQKPAEKGAVRTIEIIGTDDMKYNLATITAKPGERLRVRLISKGTMPKIAMAHNFVLLKPATSQVKFVTAGATFRDSDFVAPEMKDAVIAKTTLAGPGEMVETTFTVPNKPGSYPYLCTFPGHFQAGMRGTLEVK
jgi:azurin